MADNSNPNPDDCGGWRSRFTMLVVYTRAGEVERSFNRTSDWSPVIPGSVGEALLEFACASSPSEIESAVRDRPKRRSDLGNAGHSGCALENGLLPSQPLTRALGRMAGSHHARPHHHLRPRRPRPDRLVDLRLRAPGRVHPHSRCRPAPRGIDRRGAPRHALPGVPLSQPADDRRHAQARLRARRPHLQLVDHTYKPQKRLDFIGLAFAEAARHNPSTNSPRPTPRLMRS